MDRAVTLLAGAGLGAGLMYLFDPRNGRRRRALARDQMVRLAHQAECAANVVAKDARNRAHGLAAGDLSVLAGGRRAPQNPFQGRWSPSARALMGFLGGGLFLYGLTCEAPTACILGTAGLALMAEGVTNAGVEDVTRISKHVAETTRNVSQRTADHLGFDGRSQRSVRPQRSEQAVGSGR